MRNTFIVTLLSVILFHAVLGAVGLWAAREISLSLKEIISVIEISRRLD